MERILLYALGIIPIALSLGGMTILAFMGAGLASGSLDDNATMKSFTYMTMMIISCIVMAFLWAAYKIFGYIRSH